MSAFSNALRNPVMGEIWTWQSEVPKCHEITLRLPVANMMDQPIARQRRLQRKIRALGRKLVEAFDHYSAGDNVCSLGSKRRDSCCNEVGIYKLNYIRFQAQELPGECRLPRSVRPR